MVVRQCIGKEAFVLLLLMFLIGFLYLASQSVKKIIEINPYMLGRMAGGASKHARKHALLIP